MQSASRTPNHLCKVHTKRPERLLFVCLSKQCLTKGLLCVRCINEKHSDDSHQTMMLDQLAEEAQNCSFDQSIPQTMGQHIRAIAEAKKSCLSGLSNLRAAINRLINKAEEWIVTHFGHLEHCLLHQVEAYKAGGISRICELDLTQSTAEVNSRVLQMAAARASNRQQAAEIRAISLKTATTAQERKRLIQEEIPKLEQLVEERIATLLQPLQFLSTPPPQKISEQIELTKESLSETLNRSQLSSSQSIFIDAKLETPKPIRNKLFEGEVDFKAKFDVLQNLIDIAGPEDDYVEFVRKNYKRGVDNCLNLWFA